MASTDKVVEGIIGGAIALFVLYALAPSVASSLADAENASGISTTQATLLAVVFTIFLAGVAYKVWSMMN